MLCSGNFRRSLFRTLFGLVDFVYKMIWCWRGVDTGITKRGVGMKKTGMSALLVMLVMLVGVLVTSGWDQVQRSICALTVQTLIATESITGDVVGDVSGAASLGLIDGSFQVVSDTQLVFVAAGVTNVIDSDITSL